VILEIGERGGAHMEISSVCALRSKQRQLLAREEGNGFVLVSGTPKGAGSLSPSPAANWPLICWIKIKEIIKYRGLLYWRNQLFNSPTKLMVA
jgi:hypothetical protein